MAEQFIEEIYFYSNAASKLRCIIEKIREQDINRGLAELKGMLRDLEKICADCLNDRYEEAETLKADLLSMATIYDPIFLADLLESGVLPVMERWIQTKASIHVELDEQYVIESTASGFLTLKDMVSDHYLHSNNDPMDEARKAVEKQYNCEKEQYRLWGCGLGYHAYQLYLCSNGSIPIILYEPNDKMVEWAKAYGVLSWIPEENIKIVTKNANEAFLKNMNNQEGYFYLQAYLNSKMNPEETNLLTEEYIQNSSKWEAKKWLTMNYYRNRELNLKDISNLDSNNIKSEVAVVAGGPSVDDNLDKIRAWKGEKTIIAVGTIWKRLLREGIEPDYVVILDPYETVFGQVEGVKGSKTPLLISMIAYWKVARTYKGPIYTICVRSPIPEIEQYAKANRLDLWPSGGTVTALAMEVGIYFRAKRIYMIGVDLGYPGGISHAEGTNFRSKIDVTRMHLVEGNDGGEVYSDGAFCLYRKWMEQRIAENPQVRFINLSKNGAKIAGTYRE